MAGFANDPYDGDWALGPLGGKGIRTQVRLLACRPASSVRVSCGEGWRRGVKTTGRRRHGASSSSLDDHLED